LQILPLWKGPVFWYIHETYDPDIMLGGEASRRYFDYIIKKAKISFLFGSDGTRQVWAREGFDGCVRHWSGLTASLADKSPVVARRHDQKRIILSVGTLITS
jgi:hypothetical protein